MELIDADKLWKDTTSMIEECAEFLEIIEKQPMVDAVSVVRCKDCKHYDSHDHRCKVWNHGINMEDFCSRGERKEK